MFYPRRKEDLTSDVGPRMYALCQAMSCLVCAHAGEWVPSPKHFDCTLCLDCAYSWLEYVNDRKQKLWKWEGCPGWKKEYHNQFRRFLNYQRGVLRVASKVDNEEEYSA